MVNVIVHSEVVRGAEVYCETQKLYEFSMYRWNKCMFG